MVSRSDKMGEQMAEYIMGLVPENKGFEHTVGKVVDDKNSHFIKNSSDIIFLLNRSYTKNSFRDVISAIHNSETKYDRIISIPIKDGINYFRSVFNPKFGGIKYKQDKGLSLKNYSDADFQKMIRLTPPEKTLTLQGGIIYYQPESKNLEEKLVNYRFQPVIYDYSDIPEEKRFGPKYKDSKDVYLWTAKKDVLSLFSEKQQNF
ncbi:hypothetical protein K9L97_02700 [Candidatus Woesearchaeota archaeon]|nr:hypothetical protein [Candidatus Woesearchaeota archaeon]